MNAVTSSGPHPSSARRFPWQKEEDALLGTITDRELAVRLNRTLHCVRGRRRFLHKPALGQPPQPSVIEPEDVQKSARLFATKSDRELCTILGWGYKRIRTRRRQLAGKSRSAKAPLWTSEEDELLGTQPDHVLARKFGRHVKAVRARRGQFRIRIKKDWRPADDRILGSRTDREVAILLGRSLSNPFRSATPHELLPESVSEMTFDCIRLHPTAGTFSRQVRVR